MIFLTVDLQTPQARFEALYRTYRALMYHVSYRILGNQADAEDAAHSAFVYLAEHMHKVGPVADPKTRAYVVLIAESRAIDIYRRRQRLGEQELEQAQVGIQPDLSLAAPSQDALPSCPGAMPRPCCCATATATAAGRSPHFWASHRPMPRSCFSGPGIGWSRSAGRREFYDRQAIGPGRPGL